jgi:uroporphyrinogen decarboxylase
MSETLLTSAQRLNLTLSHAEPDRVPFFLPFTFRGALELGITPKEYFSRAEYVAEAQLRIRAKYRHDAVAAAYYASMEYEAWGGETVFYEDAPPNSGRPLITRPENITGLNVPAISDSTSLLRCLETIRILKGAVGDSAPVLGSVIAPFSLPILQLGFEKYLELIYEHPDLLAHLLSLNEEFCQKWANAQLASGASVILYTDPMTSPDITEEAIRATGFASARRVIAKIRGPVIMGFATARNLRVVEQVIRCGAVGITASALEDLRLVKAACRKKLTVVGNLNGLEMRHWTTKEAEDKVREIIVQAAEGGGFVLSEHHGEIPWDVPDDVLLAVAEAVHHWGRYPLKRGKRHGT